MRSINIRDARQKLSDLVDAAEHGQSVSITRHGKVVAQLGPPEAERSVPLPELGAFRESIRQAMRSNSKPLSRAVAESRKQARY